MNLQRELRDFLVERRARLDPPSAGLPLFGDRRRVAGLRREEVAVLAGISVDYYTRLERGRVGGVSDEVVDAVARALRLDGVEHEHLRNLVCGARDAGRRSPGVGATGPARPGIPPELQAMLDAISAPAFLQNEWFDVLGANALGHAIYPTGSEDGGADGIPNLARFFFLNPRSAAFYRDRDGVARDTVAMLRAAAGRHPDDPELLALIGLLTTRSDEFRALWARQDVVRFRSGPKRYAHPLVGEIEFVYQTLELPAHPGLTVLIYTVAPGSDTERALAFLASWTADADADATHAVDAPAPGAGEGTDEPSGAPGAGTVA